MLSAVLKIIERLINNRLVKQLETNNALSPSQFGFRLGKSTIDAVHNFINFVTSNLSCKRKALAIFLGLTKAFDIVSIALQKALNLKG